MIDELARLVAVSPDGSMARINGLVRRTCAQVLGLPPLPAEVEVDTPHSAAEEAVVDFAEQFSVDVSVISDEQRRRLLESLGREAFSAVLLMFIADFVPRVRAGLEALDLGGVMPMTEMDRTIDPADAVFNGLLAGRCPRDCARSGDIGDRAVTWRGAAPLPVVQLAARSHGVGCRWDRGYVRRHRVLRSVEFADRRAQGGAAVCRRADLVAGAHRA